MSRELLLSYAQDYVSHLMRVIDPELLDHIQLIILFGSAVRYDFTKKSDIDIFVDVTSHEAEIDHALVDITEDFYVQSEARWKPLGITHFISFKVGKLQEWEELHPSIITDGIILYGKYKPEHVKGKHCVIFSWENTRLPDSKRVLLNRKLYGYNRRGTQYDGLLEKYGGEKLSPGSIVVPLEHLHFFEKFFREYRVAARIFQTMAY
jgi:predicted nucleotidyltransferase